MSRSETCSHLSLHSAVAQREAAMESEGLRDGIFALRTRRFGSVAECMVKRLLNCSLARNLFHDLYDDARHHRIEVKFSVVQKKAERTVTEQTVVRCIEEATAEKRMVAFSEWQQHEFNCNIQQVKRKDSMCSTTGCSSQITSRFSESKARTSKRIGAAV